ncbi:MAG TPA: ADP-ribosylation factor-like protein [Planctomycetota bacterium]|jgi:signal recognition particle receptor subunit beta|nr:ADP-ribosylation factor-like protein [Planctomycetota bacterium]
MSIVNTREKTITTKLVYYGPGLGGKTTSLKVVHSVLDPDQKSKLISLNTDEERTLFFDFLPIDLGIVGGYKIKIQGFTVPGQVKYNLTRKYVLMGADGVVFVADSQAARLGENRESMENLKENLLANGLDPATIPLVIQYNKQDLPHLTPTEDLTKHLNTRGVPTYRSSATEGSGVFDAFVDAASTTIESIVRKYQLPVSNVQDTVRSYLIALSEGARS